MKVIKKTLSAILCIILFCATLFASFATPLKHSLYELSFYTKTIINDEFIAELKSHISEIIYNQVLLYEIDDKKVSERISADDLKKLSQANITAVVSSVIYGTEYKLENYENDDIRTCIEEDLQNFAKANDIEVADGVVDETYTAICNTVTVNTAIFSQSYIKHVPKVDSYLRILDYWYIGIIVAVLSIAGIVLLNLKKINSALYSLCTASWLGSALVFIPAVMLAIYNFPARLSMAIGPMKFFINTVFYGILNNVLWVSGTFFILSCIGIALAIILSLKRGKNNVSDIEKDLA